MLDPVSCGEWDTPFRSKSNLNHCMFFFLCAGHSCAGALSFRRLLAGGGWVHCRCRLALPPVPSSLSLASATYKNKSHLLTGRGPDVMGMHVPPCPSRCRGPKFCLLKVSLVGTTRYLFIQPPSSQLAAKPVYKFNGTCGRRP